MRTIVFGAFFAILAAILTVSSVRADGRDRDRGRESRELEREDHDDHHGRGRGEDRVRSLGPIDPTYAKECGSCHVPYPPALLPASAWRSILSGLDRHFGGNAELDADVRTKLERWVVDRAAPESAAARGSLRITEQPWFVDEHREVPRGAVARPAVKTMSNCSACHPGAESWDFDEHRVKIPRGQP